MKTAQEIMEEARKLREEAKRHLTKEVSSPFGDSDPGEENLIVDGQTSQIKALKPETLSD